MNAFIFVLHSKSALHHRGTHFSWERVCKSNIGSQGFLEHWKILLSVSGGILAVWICFFFCSSCLRPAVRRHAQTSFVSSIMTPFCCSQLVPPYFAPLKILTATMLADSPVGFCGFYCFGFVGWYTRGKCRSTWNAAWPPRVQGCGISLVAQQPKM